MKDKKEICQFAGRYLQLYENHQTEAKDVENTGFGDECRDLGFVMDSGEAFIRKYSMDAFFQSAELKKIIERVDDVDLLGSAVYSHWRYVTHRSEGESLLDENHRAWMITALKRMCELTGNGVCLFQGTLKKMRLISNNLCYGPKPDDDEIIEQHLTVNDRGYVWLSLYTIDGERKREYLKLKEEDVKAIFAEVTAYFSVYRNIFWVTDIGTWDLKLTNLDGSTYHYEGPLECMQGELSRISDRLREGLHREDIFGFDGMTFGISEIEMVCQSQAMKEILVLDWKKQYLRYEKREITGDTAIHEYHLKEDLDDLFCCFNAEDLASLNRPADPLRDKQRRTYDLRVKMRDGSEEKIHGIYERDGLPEDWEDFIEAVQETLGEHAAGDMFRPGVYKRRRDDVILCSVVFSEGGKPYTYIADEDIYAPGDLVTVKAGDTEMTVKIISVDYCAKEDMPYPYEKTKHILRKAGR